MYDQTLILGGGGDGSGVTGKNAAKPVTAVLVCASTFLIEKPQDHCEEKLGHLWHLKQVF